MGLEGAIEWTVRDSAPTMDLTRIKRTQTQRAKLVCVCKTRLGANRSGEINVCKRTLTEFLELAKMHHLLNYSRVAVFPFAGLLIGGECRSSHVSMTTCPNMGLVWLPISIRGNVLLGPETRKLSPESLSPSSLSLLLLHTSTLEFLLRLVE